MLRRFITAYCAQCGEAIPRAAAGRCPICLTGLPSLPAGGLAEPQPEVGPALVARPGPGTRAQTAPRPPRRRE